VFSKITGSIITMSFRIFYWSRPLSVYSLRSAKARSAPRWRTGRPEGFDAGDSICDARH